MKIKNIMFRKNSFNHEMLGIICDNMAEIYNSGLKINDAVNIIKDAVCDERYKSSLEVISCNLKKGKTLSHSFAEFTNLYPKLMISMIKIGEECGVLYFVLISLKFYYSKIFNIIKKIKGALSYPAVVFAALLFMGFYVFKDIIPNICSIYSDMNIDISKQNGIIMELGRLCSTDTFVFLMYLVIYGIAIPFIFFKFIAGRYMFKLLSYLPIYKLFCEYQIILILYIIFNSKINVSKGLNMCNDCIESEVVNNAFKEINNNINKGYDLSYSLKQCRMLSTYSLSIIKIHEESGNLEKAFFELSEKISGNIMARINKYVGAVHPILIVILAALIGFFFINIIMPIINGVNGLVI